MTYKEYLRLIKELNFIKKEIDKYCATFIFEEMEIEICIRN